MTSSVGTIDSINPNDLTAKQEIDLKRERALDCILFTTLIVFVIAVIIALIDVKSPSYDFSNFPLPLKSQTVIKTDLHRSYIMYFYLLTLHDNRKIVVATNSPSDKNQTYLYEIFRDDGTEILSALAYNYGALQPKETLELVHSSPHNYDAQSKIRKFISNR